MPGRNDTRVTVAPVYGIDEGTTVSSGRKTLSDATNGLAPAMWMEKEMLPDGAAGALTSNSMMVCLLVVGPTAFTDITSALALG